MVRTFWASLCAFAIGLAVFLQVPTVALAIVPVPGPAATVTEVTINNSGTDQWDAHVRGDLAAYLSYNALSTEIRYYRFSTAVDQAINNVLPSGEVTTDYLPYVSGSRIAFNRASSAGSAVMIFDTLSLALTEVDPKPGSLRQGVSLGGNTVAFIDFGSSIHPGKIIAHDLGTGASTKLTNDPIHDQAPRVSPDGNTIVWEHCLSSIINCDIWQAVRGGGTWVVGVTSNTGFPESHPDTDGKVVVYSSSRPTSVGGADIYFRPVGGGPEVQLELGGIQSNPAIAGSFVVFESQATAISQVDLYAYDIAQNLLYQLTSTLGLSAQFADITSLPTGGLRIVWRSDDGSGDGNILGATFYPSCGYFATSSLLGVAKPFAVAMGDFNGDGKLDLAVTDFANNTVAMMLGNGVGGFGAATTSATGPHPIAVAVGDFNGDGRLDLAVANYSGNSVSILLGNGAGGFGAASTIATGLAPVSIAVGDFNGDGKLDLAVANVSDNTVSILLGNGAGGFGPATAVVTGPGAFGVSVGDFNGDGKLDLAVANLQSTTVSILLGNGAGGFGAATAIAAGPGPSSIAVGDFNGDGKLDLAVSNVYSNTMSILLGNGAGGFGPATTVAVGPGPVAVAAGDFNGDGKLDLAVANYSGNSVSILLGNGAGGFGAGNIFVGASPRSIAVGDFNGDGKLDLAVANSAGRFGTVSLLRNACGTSTPTIMSFQNPPPNTSGWNNTDVTVTFTATGAVSPTTCSPSSVVVTSEGANQTIGTICTDAAGNNANASRMVSIDKTPPVVNTTFSRSQPFGTPPPTILVTFSCSDTLSGIASCPSQILVSMGVHTVRAFERTVGATATDKAANSSTGGCSRLDQFIRGISGMGWLTVAQANGYIAAAQQAKQNLSCP